MKKRIFVLTVLLIAFGCQQKPDFQLTNYHFKLVQKDSSDFINGTYSKSDTVTGAISNGAVTAYDNMFYGYNDSLISISKNKIVPRGTGVTKIMIRYPNDRIDSIKIEVSYRDGKFIIKQI